MVALLLLIAVILFGIHVAETRGRAAIAWAWFFLALALAWPAFRALVTP